MRTLALLCPARVRPLPPAVENFSLTQKASRRQSRRPAGRSLLAQHRASASGRTEASPIDRPDLDAHTIAGGAHRLDRSAGQFVCFQAEKW